MNIAILGAGRIGGTLGRKWVEAEHAVQFGVRDPLSPKTQAALEAVQGRASAASIAEAVLFGDVVVFALPNAAMQPAVADNAAALAGKVVVDASNRFGAPEVSHLSAFQQHAPDARYYRAFNSLGWEVFAEPFVGGAQADLFYCGAPGEGQAAVEQLIVEVGLRPVRVGDVDQTALVDALGALWVTLAVRQGLGRRLAFRMLRDE